ncbi:hypothetical protein DPMN_146523 [Dreissena polymorpha]|uniref:Uncharacterized protein n=1 Tax=Dreissena polymorpha TaxID=45954 RepID=A0A9D4F824_DREPO|nr:hypothetical protein DPMN_146523 [Dreissena polymorpha]
MWAVAPTNKIGERQPLRRADNAGAGSSRLAGYRIAVPKHGAIVFGNSEHVSGSGFPGTGSVQEPIPTTAVFKRRWYIIFVFSLGSFIQVKLRCLIKRKYDIECNLIQNVP